LGMQKKKKRGNNSLALKPIKENIKMRFQFPNCN